ncbi:MAG: 30S ribosomal protein S4 [Candidatus Peregrinibacteria bacterium]
MRYTGPKARLCRRLGVNLFGTEKYNKILTKRNVKPGMHGGKSKGKTSEYGRQLLEKQKARIVFGLSERQFQNYFKRAMAGTGDTGENLLRLLERRLDNVVYVAQFAVTRMQARQMVNHAHFKLNGRRVDVPSLLVKPGDKIELVAKLVESPLYRDLGELKDYAPKWLKVELKKGIIQVLDIPAKDDLEKTIESQLIVEYYSR